MLDYGEILEPIRRPISGTFWKKGLDCWEPFPEDIAKELKTRRFFSRFEVQDLQNFLPRMKVRQHSVNDVIFPDNEVFIILGGTVETKRHIYGERVPVPCNIYR